MTSSRLPFILLTLYVFGFALAPLRAARRVSILETNAVADGKTLNTAAIQTAIDRVAADGGGTVVIPEGRFVSGALFFKPGVNLELAKGAVLQCSTDLKNFPEQRTWIEGHYELAFNTGLINAEHCDGLRISGEGILDGAGKPIWNLFWKLRNASADRKNFRNLSVPRARLAIISRSKNVVIDGVTFKDSQFWNLHLFRCEHVTVQHTRFVVPDNYKQAPSTDGIDIDCSSDVSISQCFFSVTDDCIAAKGPKGPDAQQNKDGAPTEHIRVNECTFARGGAALTLGSEAGTVRDVRIENCEVRGSMPVLQCKLRPDTPQIYENIEAHDIVVANENGSLLRIAPWSQYAESKGGPPPQSIVQHIRLSNIKGRTHSVARIEPNPGQTAIRDIQFRDINITAVDNHPAISPAARDVVFANVIINGKPFTAPLAWPTLTKENRPGTRWWWMGNAIEPTELTRELNVFHDAGIGTVEINPIYGVHGYEAQTIPYLSPKWLEAMNDTVAEAKKLGMDVDMVTGTGWCFGGPTVSNNNANAVAVYKDGVVTEKPTLKVKRPAPGEEGWMLNLLYPDAMNRYLCRFSDAFAEYKGAKPHAQFHDSYEYKSDWSPDFSAQFERRRGYKLEPEFPALFENRGDSDRAARVRSDYRETVSELIADSIGRWTAWSHEYGFVSRNQAHGSPGNWLDIYAESDVPETEFDFARPNILVAKFASSAANTTGKPIASSETGTWAAEHFNETLGRLKQLCDEFFLSGVNHIMWHGTTYSPPEATWPGWCFYASSEINPRNALWHDIPALHTYLSHTQSFLQSGHPDNDVLLYWPIYDLWHDPASKGDLAQALTVHEIGWFNHQSIGQTAEALWNRGYAFDYISDNLLARAKADHGAISLATSRYRAVIVPRCTCMPLTTLRKLRELADAGVTVIFEDLVPIDVPGLQDLEKEQTEFRALASRFSATRTSDLDSILTQSGVRRERSLTEHEGVHYIRRAVDGGFIYFILNQSTTALDAPITLATQANYVAIFDPMSGQIGLGECKEGAVRLQLAPDQSILLRTFTTAAPNAPAWEYNEPTGAPVQLSGRWKVRFIDGGPALPKPFETSTLESWTKLGDADAGRFSGTALYTLRFDAPSTPAARRWQLDLGEVMQSARVRLNGVDLGTVFAPPYRVSASELKPKDNLLEIEVTGTSANRIRDLDTRQVKWKIFYDINIVGKDYKPLNAATWPIAPQGLLGPVTLQAEAGR